MMCNHLQVDAYCHDSGKLRVVGYYHANERLNELDLKPYARRIADKVQQRVPQAVTLQVCCPSRLLHSY